MGVGVWCGVEVRAFGGAVRWLALLPMVWYGMVWHGSVFLGMGWMDGREGVVDHFCMG